MYLKDRLAELKNRADETLQNDSVHFEEQGDVDEKLQEILTEGSRIRKWINEINENTKTMKRLYSEPTFQASKQLQDEMDYSMSSSKTISLKICRAFREFQDKIGNHQEGTVMHRIITLQMTTMNQLFANALHDQENFSNKYQESRMTILSQQIKLTNQSITEEECQGLLDTVDNIEAGTREAKQALQDVESRHKELIKIESDIKDVMDLFLQMDQLMSQQQDLVNTAENFTNQASNNIDSGNRELQKAHQNKKKTNKTKIIIICVVAAIIILILILFK